MPEYRLEIEVTNPLTCKVSGYLSEALEETIEIVPVYVQTFSMPRPLTKKMRLKILRGPPDGRDGVQYKVRSLKMIKKRIKT